MPLCLDGTTKDKAVCRRRLDGLEVRRFDPSAGVLFVMNAGKTMYRKDRSSDVALIRQHKSRNVTELSRQCHNACPRDELTGTWAIADAEVPNRHRVTTLPRSSSHDGTGISLWPHLLHPSPPGGQFRQWPRAVALS